jgi:hypothetical protein
VAALKRHELERSTPHQNHFRKNMRKKQRYGGLSPRHVRLIRDFLHKVYSIAPDAWDAYNVWTWLLLNCEWSVKQSAKAAVSAQGRSTR